MSESPRKSVPENEGPQHNHQGGGSSPSGPSGFEGQPRPDYSTPRYQDVPNSPSPGPQGQPGPPTNYSQQRTNSDPGFFAALFDLSFRHFITLKFATFIYVLAIAMSGLTALILIVGAIATEEPLVIFMMLIIAAVGFLANIVLTRVVLELVISMIRTAQNTSAMVDRAR